MTRHIALFIPTLEGGGAESVMVRLAGLIADEGYRVSLVVGTPSGTLRRQVASSVQLVDLNRNRMRSCIWPLARFLMRERPDAILSTPAHANLVAVLASAIAKYRGKLVLRESTTPSSIGEQDGVLHSWARRTIMFCYRYSAAIIVGSQGMKDDLVNFNVPESAIHVIPNPLKPFRPGCMNFAQLDQSWLQRAHPVILGVGRLAPEKDFETLIQASKLVRLRVPARLMVLGEGALRQRLSQLAEESGFGEDFYLPGWVDQPQWLMPYCKVFVLSSKREGLPNALIEAVAAGIPVVATDCPSGPREILEGGVYGELVPVGDVEAMAEAILRALDEGARAGAAHAICERYDARAVTRMYLRILLDAEGS